MRHAHCSPPPRCPHCGQAIKLKQVPLEWTQGSRHCEEQSDEAIQVLFPDCFALRFAVGSQSRLHSSETRFSSHNPVVWARIARAAGVLLLNVRAC
jgi:hypothetical protein